MVTKRNIRFQRVIRRRKSRNSAGRLYAKVKAGSKRRRIKADYLASVAANRKRKKRYWQSNGLYRRY